MPEEQTPKIAAQQELWLQIAGIIYRVRIWNLFGLYLHYNLALNNNHFFKMIYKINMLFYLKIINYALTLYLSNKNQSLLGCLINMSKVVG